MGEIELVIKMPEQIYRHYKKVWQKKRGSIPESCIAFGIPLPKGHGKLIDADKVISDGIDKGFCDWYDELKNADVILEADNESDVNE